MKETLFVENMNGNKSYYDLEVISKNDEKKEITIKHWNKGQKTLKYDEKKKCYVSIN